MMHTRYPLRTSGLQLPHAAELLDILREESPRKAVRFDYLQINSELFEAHRELAKKASSNTEWIDGYADMPLDTLVDAITQTHKKIAHYIATRPGESDLCARVFAHLAAVTSLADSEAIFVFGSESNARINYAIELYDRGVAPKIILSGKGPHYREHHEPEAHRMAQVALQAGVPREAIVLEDRSITLPDNVKRTIDLFETLSWQPSSLTIVATNFVLRRATMEWYKFAPWPISINAVAPAPISTHFTEKTWYQNTDSTTLVLNEYAKLILESKIDLMRR